MPKLRRFMALSATNVSRSALARPSSRAVRLPTSRILQEIQLPGGRFRGFVAGGHTFAIDGDHPCGQRAQAR